MARPLLALGGIVLIGVGVAAGFGFLWPSKARADAEVTTPITKVRLDNGSGETKIRTGSGPVRIHQEFSYRWSKPSDSYKVDGDTLVLQGCGKNCSVDYDVIVPAGVPVTGRNDSGGVRISGVASVDVTVDSGRAEVTDVAGPVKLAVDSGATELRNIGQDVTVRSDSGSVTGSGLRGKVDVKADSGRVELKMAASNDVKVHADSGSIEVDVPGGPYRVLGNTDSGHRDIGVSNDASAPHTLDLTTDSGSVKVRAA
ncbi:DUF4097 family beta strand repeat-containing protein [Amycolatopsis sp. NPDC059021]|uniref:DUF4097 family beta strand repeat-containing protein n=1 Tax=Amycolatopsis sp. NPDC059021 TaxID=3346704 RepID=UPI00366F2EE2